MAVTEAMSQIVQLSSAREHLLVGNPSQITQKPVALDHEPHWPSCSSMLYSTEVTTGLAERYGRAKCGTSRCQMFHPRSETAHTLLGSNLLTTVLCYDVAVWKHKSGWCL
eukprot:1328464-Amphidinium_carterae.3